MPVRHKQLTVEEVLEYVAFAVWSRDLPEDFDGDVTCEMNEDGSVEVYAVEENEREKKSLN